MKKKFHQGFPFCLKAALEYLEPYHYFMKDSSDTMNECCDFINNKYPDELVRLGYSTEQFKVDFNKATFMMVLKKLHEDKRYQKATDELNKWLKKSVKYFTELDDKVGFDKFKEGMASLAAAQHQKFCNAKRAKWESRPLVNRMKEILEEC